MRSQSFFSFVTALAISLASPLALAQAPVPDSPAIEQKVDAMLAKLSLEQKIDLIGGEDNMFIRAEPGFPRLKMSDGPLGVRTWGPDTAYAAGIAMAASWDPELANRIGRGLGRDARARGVHFLLGPGVNIYRAPMNGRNFEYLGEDPYLAAHMVVPYIQGVQSEGVVATVKHFALNNQEWDRHNASSDADECTIREIYFPAFEAAVKEGQVGAVMNSYNLINGVHATQNDWLNNQVLKKEWSFNGILMSDWDATYDGVAAANGGLDLEMPSGRFMNRKNLLPAVQDGKVSTAVIDDKVRRIFRTAIRFGFLDRDQADLNLSLFSQQDEPAALAGAAESIVLLKNENHLLPLDPARVQTIALVGPDAWPAVSGGGGSAATTPFEAVSLLAAMRAACPRLRTSSWRPASLPRKAGLWTTLHAAAPPSGSKPSTTTHSAVRLPRATSAGSMAGGPASSCRPTRSSKAFATPRLSFLRRLATISSWLPAPDATPTSSWSMANWSSSEPSVKARLRSRSCFP
jgi:beta-glucosidase